MCCMHKRGSIEVVIVLAVLVVAVIGAYFSLIPGRSSSGLIMADNAYSVKDFSICQRGCYEDWHTALEIRRCVIGCQGDFGSSVTGGFVVPDVAYADYGDSGNSITGGFAVPGAKEYGGSIRGVAVTGTRAFPAGRAFELPEQACYACSCIEQGITASDRAAAERVCSENCGGTIAEEFRVGPCN